MISQSFVIEVASPSFLELFTGGRYFSSLHFGSHFGSTCFFSALTFWIILLEYLWFYIFKMGKRGKPSGSDPGGSGPSKKPRKSAGQQAPSKKGGTKPTPKPKVKPKSTPQPETVTWRCKPSKWKENLPDNHG